MNSATPRLTHVPPQPASPLPVPPRRGSASLDRPTWSELLDDTAAMIGAPAFFGPPILFVLGPWLLLVLLLIGPFALLVTGLLIMAVVAGLLAMVIAAIASPYLLIRQLHVRGALRVKSRPRLHTSPKHRVRSDQVASLQPKGMS